MGLDISFYNKPKNEDRKPNEVAYFRKHNWLLPFFNYGENLSDKIITDEQLEDFITKAKKILESSVEKRTKIASETIPTTDGFFFGGTAYDAFYFDGLKYDIEKFERILKETDFTTESIIMNCWW